MALASGSQVLFTYAVEATLNTVPTTGNHTALRTTGRNINKEKALLESQEVRPSGQRADVRHGFNQVVGSPVFELSLEDFDDAFALALRNVWQTITVTGGGGVLDITAPDGAGLQTINMEGGATLITDGVRPGDLVEVTLSANAPNNGRKRVVSVPSETALVVINPLGEVEAPDASAVLAWPGARIDLGNLSPEAGGTTWSVERVFEDISQYQLFSGVGANSLQITVSPEAVIQGTLNLLGMDGGAITGATGLPGTRTNPTSNSVFAAFDATLVDASAVLATVTSLDFTVNLNRSLSPVIGSKTSPSLFDGTAVVNGTMQAFLDDNAATGTLSLINKFDQEIESQLFLEIRSADGTQWLNLIFYRVKYNSANIDPPQQGAVPAETAFEALEQATYATAFAVQRSNPIP